MLMAISLHRGWVTKQIDFSNAIIQVDQPQPVYFFLPVMFQDTSGAKNKDLCLCPKKSLYGQCNVPKLWADHLKRGLKHANILSTAEAPAVFIGCGMAIAVYVNDVLFFGPDEAAMEAVISDLQSEKYKLKCEKTW